MDAAFEFSFNGLNMEFAINLAAEGHSVPDLLFVDIMTEKCQLLHQHIKSLKDCLMLVTNIGHKMATIKLFDKNLMDSQFLHLSRYDAHLSFVEYMNTILYIVNTSNCL